MPGIKIIMLRTSSPYLVIVLAISFFNACQNQPIETTGVGPTTDDAKPAVPGPTDRPPAPSPSAAAPLTSFPATAGTVEDRRRPGPGITASAVLPDGSFWYAFELFDSMGGSTPGSKNQGFYRLLDGQVTHLTHSGPKSYPWSADMPAPPELLDKLFDLQGR